MQFNQPMEIIRTDIDPYMGIDPCMDIDPYMGITKCPLGAPQSKIKNKNKIKKNQNEIK